MAARKGIVLTDSWKKKIQIGVILDQLIKHVQGKNEMSTTQIAAAKILLSKVIPDMKAVEHTGEVTTNYVLRLPQTATSVEQWQQQNSQVTIQ
jgi:hypothetical protein